MKKITQLISFSPFLVILKRSKLVIFKLPLSFQYFIFLYIFSFIGIYFQRVQAIIGIVESYACFYSGIVISSTKFSIPIFSFIQNITNHQYQSLPILLISMLIEVILVYIGTIWITKHIKSM